MMIDGISAPGPSIFTKRTLLIAVSTSMAKKRILSSQLETSIEIIWLVVWNLAFFPCHIWVGILPIDELHHISEG